ncbi:MAG: methyltransferase, partial [Raineya sp.]|nr:methyltransferase [Raineya sp.]
MKNFWIICLFLLLLTACKHYHNITAHYNAYFLAKEKMLEAEKRIFSSRKDNYNRILYVIPLLDTNMLKGMKADFDDCIKKAAYAIERHEISNWTDDSYLLVGKARFYNREFSDAITTFKYINGTSQDKIMQEKALIELMRTYIEINQWNDADVVKNYLRKIEVSPKNLEQYYLVQAHLYRLRKDYERTAKSLELAIPEMKKGEKKARILFLQGQLYQKLKNDKKAFENYAKVLKNKPPYELELQANLAMLLTGDSAKVFSAKTQRKLEKMVKDFKNQEFLDEIYYDLAMLELKRNDLRKAVDLLKKSAQAKGSGGQKPYTFLRLAEIHFDKLRDYETA